MAELSPQSVDHISSSANAVKEAGKDIIAGTVGGMATVVVGHPLDTLKVRLQTQSSVNPKYAGFLDCARKTLAEEGIRGYYKGMQSPLLGEGFFNAVQFVAYGAAKRWLQGGNSDYELTVQDHFMAGAMTGFLSVIVESPIDFFKTQLQVQVLQPKPRYTTFPACVSMIASQYGIRGVYQGLGSTWLRTIPASAAYFGVYEYSRRLMQSPGQKRDDLESWKVLSAGGIAGFAYWLSCYPADSIKTAMQSDAINPKERVYPTIVKTARALYAEGGIARFYKGLAPCMIRSFPANAACFLAYEKAMAVLS